MDSTWNGADKEKYRTLEEVPCESSGVFINQSSNKVLLRTRLCTIGGLKGTIHHNLISLLFCTL